MRWVTLMALGIGGSAALGRCGDDSGDGGDGSGDGGDGSGIDWSQLDPPEHIDIESCFHITDDGSGQISEACTSCCQSAGFSASSTLNDDHCTCGTNPPDDRETVCAAHASGSTSEPCATCCSEAGFSGYSWVGGSGASSQCACRGTVDRSVCASALAHSAPSEACFYCCLQNGFLSAGYVGIGERECSCIGL